MTQSSRSFQAFGQPFKPHKRAFNFNGAKYVAMYGNALWKLNQHMVLNVGL